MILYAEAQLAKEEGDKQAKDFDDYVAGKHFDNLMPSNMSGRFQYYTPNPDRKNLIPGDRVRMKNHKFAQPPDEDGYEGSNVIYLGKDDAGHQLFIHMDGGGVERYEALQKTVKEYSQPSSRQDHWSKYKFTERYEPSPWPD